MSKRHYWIIVDTETTIKDTVADFGAVICDRKGKIYTECGILVQGHYGIHELFYDVNADNIWSKQGLEQRKKNYTKMLNTGTRMVASVNAINTWLNKAVAHYSPELTAYNLAFDLNKCDNTGIDLSVFDRRFCLWHAAAGNWGHTKKFREFVLDNHMFNPPTKLGNMSYKTNAEVMAGFLTGNYMDEPHTALEDAKFFEMPILVALLKKRNWREMARSYNWKNYQLRNWFRAAESSDPGSLL